MTDAWPKRARYVFASRHGGYSAEPFDTLNVGHLVGDSPLLVAENRANIAASLGLDASHLFFATQEHGTGVATITARTTAAGVADILLTDEPGIGIAVYTADCAPILMAHPRGVAAVHGGWRGAAANVCGIAVKALCDLLGAPPHELTAKIGPTIGSCCYTVGAAVAQELAEAGKSAPIVEQRTKGAFAVDLVALHAIHLEQAGLPPAQIQREFVCTACCKDYFSYRRDGGRSGRQANAIALA